MQSAGLAMQGGSACAVVARPFLASAKAPARRVIVATASQAASEVIRNACG